MTLRAGLEEKERKCGEGRSKFTLIRKVQLKIYVPRFLASTFASGLAPAAGRRRRVIDLEQSSAPIRVDDGIDSIYAKRITSITLTMIFAEKLMILYSFKFESEFSPSYLLP